MFNKINEEWGDLKQCILLWNLKKKKVEMKILTASRFKKKYNYIKGLGMGFSTSTLNARRVCLQRLCLQTFFCKWVLILNSIANQNINQI